MSVTAAGDNLRRWPGRPFVTPRAVCSSPTWLVIESLLVPLDAIPANVMRPAVGVDRFDDVIGFTITSFATTYCIIQKTQSDLFA